MKGFSFIVVILLAMSGFFGQGRGAKTSVLQGPGKKEPELAGWKIVQVEKFGVESLNLPAGFTEEPETTESLHNGDVTWTNYSRAWKRRSGDSEVNFSVRTWDADFSKVLSVLQPARQLRSEVTTPENLLRIEFEETREKIGHQGYEEASLMEVHGLTGIFFRGKSGDRRMSGWYTYRHYDNHAQKINIFIIDTGKDPNYKKIIQSIKFR